MYSRRSPRRHSLEPAAPIAALWLALTLLASTPSPAAAQPRDQQRATPPRESAGALPRNVERLDSLGGITQYRLKSNGMTILLSRNDAAPVVTFEVVYHVGSRNEAPGTTGSAHLLEHLLFNKSTKNFGRARGQRTFQEVLFQAGCDFSSTNMTTGYDRMNGYSTLPADKLELAMRIEADRLGRALILDSERQPEMTVVRNEYEIGENNPARALYKAVVGAAIVAHPYHWDPLGYRSDIEGVSTEALRQHYRDFFWPDNAEAILVGDFDTATALRMFDREFGSFPRSSKPVPSVITVEPPQEGERRVIVRRPGEVGLVKIGYMRPSSLHPDFIPLDVLSTILGSGVNSRLYQALVEKGFATGVSASNYALRDPFPILIDATVAQGVSHQKVEDAMKAALYAVGRDGVTPEELARAKSQLEVTVIRGRDGTYELAASLGEAVASANWKWFLQYVDTMNRVTAEDVRRVAATYLIPDHATVGWFVPAKADGKKPQKAAGAGGSTESSASSGRSAGEPAHATFAQRTLHRVLANGITLDVLANHAVPTVAVHGIVLAGRMHTPWEKPALGQLTAMMLERGTKTLDKRAIAARLDGVGARLHVTADMYGATIQGSSLSRDTKLLLSVLADEMKSPAFSDSELTKAKAEMKTDVLRAFDDTRQRAFDRLSQIAFPVGHPYHARSKDETLTSIAAARPADLRAFHKDRYVGASTYLAIVGDVDPARVAALVDSLLDDLPRGSRPDVDMPRVPRARPSHEAVALAGKANMDLMFGAASGLRRKDPDYEASLVANAALGQSSLSSRLGKRVRDTEGLTYNIYSRFTMTDFLDGVWLADVAVAPANLGKAMKSTREVIESYCKDGITEEEVATQKSFFAGNYRVQLATNAGTAQALVLAEKFGYGPSYLDEFPDRVGRVTREEVNAAIRAHLDPTKLSIIVAGDLEKFPE
ncbi:MAG: insulinase family protein [Candidatus Eisenbacteria bacterium]|uniref:Insulinase family protein n=1 Tax=Eiseniibacteriota bacterium TaxID=2212470 RepID=A0A538SPK3_UNCEI|nr:MAG: insulinase family protein [Candidatus Eisenbacteria bacterium]